MSSPESEDRARRRATRGLLVASATLAALVAPAAPVAARELSWRSIDVVARIEADGTLRVAETQAMVMSGDWNGGERSFRVAPGQSVRVERIVRIDPASGAETVLERGRLDRVDRWEWSDRSTVRWRSRLPSDPAFERTLLVYRLEFAYERVFSAQDDGSFELTHDFAFTDRAGPIERYSLELGAAPGWRVVGVLQVEGGARSDSLPARFEAGPLDPGRGYVVRGRFAWSGGPIPERAAPRRIASWFRRALASGVAASALLFGLFWWRRDAALGRFTPLTAPQEIDAAWLEAKLLSVRPEIVGAAWDRSIGSAEVAAILARLVAEKRMGSRVERQGWGPFGRDVLHLELLVSREAFDADEKSLVAGLFPSGDQTDTDSLRAHYRSRGFNPVSRIRSRLEARVRALGGFAAGAPRPKRSPTVFLLVVGLALIACSPLLQAGGEMAFLMLIVTLLASLPGFVGAGVGRSRVGWPAGGLIAIASSVLFFTLVGELLGGVLVVPPIAVGGAALVACGLLRAMFQILSTPESAASMATRRDLASARRFFIAELRRDVPRLEDRWFPWLVALGLADECDRWARRFAIVAGGAPTAVASRGGGWTSTASGQGAGGGAAGGWSGGGGSFGGAGASASFAAAVSTMATGVPAPSSSGSSGGGGGGGSSSGGGGGGGW